MSRFGRGAAAGLIAVAALVAFFVWTPARAPSAPAAKLSSAPAGPDGAPSGPAMTLQGLRGTKPSGRLEVDTAGHFVPTPEALLFFQYFLSASNEASPGELTRHIEQAIGERLEAPADAQARAFLSRYMAYLEAGDVEFRAPGLVDSAALERRIQWVRELRREHFGAALAERLFGEEEAAQRVHMERLRIARDPAFDPAADRSDVIALEQDYPEAVREARARASLPLRHAHEERELREAGASDAEIDALRATRFGPEAAARMRSLDRRRAEWSARVAAYRTARDERLSGLDDAGERAEALATLRASHFSAEELDRIEVLDRQETPSTSN